MEEFVPDWKKKKNHVWPALERFPFCYSFRAGLLERKWGKIKSNTDSNKKNFISCVGERLEPQSDLYCCHGLKSADGGIFAASYCIHTAATPPAAWIPKQWLHPMGCSHCAADIFFNPRLSSQVVLAGPPAVKILADLAGIGWNPSSAWPA